MTLVPADTGEVGFATSGSTAEPVVWVRTAEQLRAEVELVATTVLGPIEHVVTFAPPTHLYGRLFGKMLPDMLGVGVDDLSGEPLAPPSVVGRRTLYVCLPASWLVLHGSVPRDADLSGSIALHGTGPVSAPGIGAVAALTAAGLRAVELFGSTETGGIAHRSMTGNADEPWQLLPDVALINSSDANDADGTCLLHVRSPRIARRTGDPGTDTHRLADLIRPIGPDRFVYLGRGSRLIKINGRRCDLARVEDALAAAVPGIDAVCVGVPDRVRGEHYELFYANGPAEGADWLHVALGELPRPRAVHRVPQVPRTITGKVKIDRLLAAAMGSGR